MAKCPWYINGMCYSEKTINEYNGPSPQPTHLGYCLSDNYRECPYYVEASSSEEELLESIEASIRERYYPPIHVIPCEYRSNCPYFQLKRIDKQRNLCVAKCRVTGQYIVRSKVVKCIEHWNNCPFYKIGIEENL